MMAPDQPNTSSSADPEMQAESVQSTGIRCIACRYDLSAQMISGLCPECGAPVARSLLTSALPQSSKAVAAFVVGICGLILGCPTYGIFWILLGVIAVVLAVVARRDIAEGRADGRSWGLATAALVLGWISLGLGLLVILVLGWAWIGFW